MMEFNQLHSYDSCPIFKSLTTRELIQCGHVCHKWTELQESEFATRDTLVLLLGGPAALDAWVDSCFNEFITDNDNETMSPSGVWVPVDTLPDSPQYLAKWFGFSVGSSSSFSHELAQFLVRKMPKIKRLIIVSTEEGPSWTQDVLFMLTQWAHQLVTVKLFVRSGVPLTTQQRTNVLMILGTLNGCGQLAHLTVDLQNELELDAGDVQLHLPILAQLSEFYFGSYDSPQMLIETFIRYGQSSDRLTRLGHRTAIGQYGDYTEVYDVLERNLTDKFTHLLGDLEAYSEDVDGDGGFVGGGGYCGGHFVTMCAKFANLTHLHLNIDLCQVRCFRVFAQLASLTRLVVLNLDISSASDWVGHPDVPPLSSVRVLKLDMYNLTLHESLEELTLHKAFPGLECIELVFIDITECDICGHAGVLTDTGDPANIARLETCIRRSIEPLLFCHLLIKGKVKFPAELHAILPNCTDIVLETLEGIFVA